MFSKKRSIYFINPEFISFNWVFEGLIFNYFLMKGFRMIIIINWSFVFQNKKDFILRIVRNFDKSSNRGIIFFFQIEFYLVPINIFKILMLSNWRAWNQRYNLLWIVGTRNWFCRNSQNHFQPWFLINAGKKLCCLWDHRRLKYFAIVHVISDPCSTMYTFLSNWLDQWATSH